MKREQQTICHFEGNIGVPFLFGHPCSPSSEAFALEWIFFVPFSSSWISSQLGLNCPWLKFSFFSFLIDCQKLCVFKSIRIHWCMFSFSSKLSKIYVSRGKDCVCLCVSVSAFFYVRWFFLFSSVISGTKWCNRPGFFPQCRPAVKSWFNCRL